MNKECIEGFLAIIRCETLSNASSELYISQSTLTHRIQVLEKELGFPLFVHKKGFRRLELTENGKRFIPLAMRWMEITSEMYYLKSGKECGAVRIGAMDSVNQFLLQPILPAVQKRLDSIQMVCLSYHSEHIYAMLSSGNLDFGFAFRPMHFDIMAIPVFKEPFYMISAKNSIYPDGPVHPSDLKKENEIMPKWDSESRIWNDEWWDPYILPKVSVDSSGLMLAFLDDPEAWSICPASAAISLLKTNQVSIHAFEIDPPVRICHMLFRKELQKDMPKGTKMFLDLFFEELKKHPWQYI